LSSAPMRWATSRPMGSVTCWYRAAIYVLDQPIRQITVRSATPRTRSTVAASGHTLRQRGRPPRYVRSTRRGARDPLHLNHLVQETWSSDLETAVDEPPPQAGRPRSTSLARLGPSSPRPNGSARIARGQSPKPPYGVDRTRKMTPWRHLGSSTCRKTPTGSRVWT
jgi:hypothetical protein